MSAKGSLFLIFSFAFFAAAAGGTNWHMYKSFPTPPNVRGYSYFGGVLLTDGSPPRVWQFDIEGNFFNPVDLDLPRGAWGVDWQPSTNDCWVSHYGNSHVYRMTSDGSVISSFRCPRDHPADITRFIVPYGDLAIAIPDDNVVLFLTTTGSVVSSYAGPGTGITAVSFSYGGTCHGDAGTGKVYTWDGTFNVGAVGGVGTNQPVSGYYSNIHLTDMATDTFQYWNWGGVAEVGPASLGRVKALFR